MSQRDLVVVGASAGGVEALRDLVRELPEDLSATVLVVLHLPSSAFSALPQILARATGLAVLSAEDGAPLEPGVVLVAPPGRHLLVRDDHVALGLGPKENGHRPAIDPLFRSAARWRGRRTVGVVLSGTLDDGAAGLLTIVERGGAAVVQDPETALYDGMPCAALRAVPDATTASGPELARVITKYCAEEVPEDPIPVSRVLEMETQIPHMDEASLADRDRPGRPAAMTCPDCNGAMFELDEGNVIRYRCRVGHAWSPQTLLLQHGESAETALWAAIRTLEEKAALHRNLAERRAGNDAPVSRRYHSERAEEAQASAAVIRDLVRHPVAGIVTEAAHSAEGSR
jgi:two-component system chemotaxis response regulator CheB